MKTISTRELQELQSNKEGSALVNVLSQADFRKGSIPGSSNAPVDSSSFLQDVESQTGGDKQKRVVVYCAGPKCDASERAGTKLTEAGYANVQVYRGGMEEWNASQSGGRGQSNTPSAPGERKAGSDAAEMAKNRGGSAREQNAPAPGERSTVGASRGGDGGARAQEQASGTGAPGTASPLGQRQGNESRGGAQARGGDAKKSSEGGLEYGDTSKPKDGTEKQNERGGSREDRGDNTPGSDPKREIGTTPPEPGYTTTAPHPDVIKPQSRSGERRTSPPETSAPKQAAPGAGAGAGADAPSGGASQGTAS